MKKNNNILRMIKKHPFIYMVITTILVLFIIGFVLLQHPGVNAMKRVMLNEVAYLEDYSAARAVATHFGYQQNNEIGTYTPCQNIMIVGCGIVMVYYIDVPFDSFEQTMFTEEYTGSIHVGEASYGDLFYSMERISKIITSNEDLSTKVEVDTPGRFWRLDKNGRSIDIIYYDIQSSKYQFTLDNEVLHRNIVIVVYQTLNSEKILKPTSL